MKQMLSYIFRGLICIFILGLSFLLVPKTTVGSVYLRSLENRVADMKVFPHQVLGGGVMDISINGQRADSLLIRTPLPPLEAVQRLYEAHHDPDGTSSKEIFGVIGEEHWATYMDLFPGKMEEEKSGTFLETLISRPENPALVIAAHRDEATNSTIVNFLTFTEVADLRKAFMQKDAFNLDFHAGDKTLGQMSFEQEIFRSAENVAQDYIAKAMEEGLALQLKTGGDGVTALHFTGHQKTRDIFIKDTGHDALGIIIQNRNAKGIKTQ